MFSVCVPVDLFLFTVFWLKCMSYHTILFSVLLLYMCKDARGVNGPGVLAVLTQCCLNIIGVEPRGNGRCISIGSFVMRMDHKNSTCK